MLNTAGSGEANGIVPTSNYDGGRISDTSQPQANFSSSIFSYGYSQNVLVDEAPGIYGTKSIFNAYAIFRYEGAAGDNTLLYDIAGQAGTKPANSVNPTVANIINITQESAGFSSAFGASPYSYSDFLYCKYNAVIPNNYLVTLRRYPMPMLDNLKTHDGKSIPPIAQAVTWFGQETGNSLKDVLKFSFGLIWKEIESTVQDVTGNEKGFDDGPLANNPGGKAISTAIGALNPKQYSGLAQAQTEYAQGGGNYGAEGPFANKVYGPVNVISKTLARDRGMKFENTITLNFHYSLKSIGNINPKMAMLDIISNLLTLTYNNAKFWGGAVRYFPQYPHVKFFGDQTAFYNGDTNAYFASVMKAFGSLGKTFMNTFEKLLSDPLSALKELVSGGAGLLLGAKAAQTRPQLLAMRSLLTGEPIGEWHLVVGNPMNPIAMIGNLVCDNVEMEFSDELGNDDFPVELKCTIFLRHGKPRDKGDIESMFNLGNGRLYYGIPDSAFSSTQQSNMDTSKGVNQVGGKTVDKSQNTIQTTSEAKANSNVATRNTVSSIWGNRFTQEELNISKLFAGSFKGTPKTTKK